MRETNRAYLDMTLAMILVGSSVVAGKFIVQAFPVFLASGLRFLIAGVILLPLVWKREGRLFSFSRRDWGVLVVMAFCGQFMFTSLLLVGLKHTSAVEAGLITSTTPAVMTVLAFLILGERIRAVQAIGAGLAVIGVVFSSGLAWPSKWDGLGGHMYGNLLVCGAVAGEAVFLLLRKAIAPTATDMGTAAALVVLGFLMFLVPGLIQMDVSLFRKAGPVGWGAILYFGAFFTAVAYFLWFRGVSKAPGATAGVFTAVMPVSAVALSWLILGEPVEWNHLLGAAFVLAAIGLTTLGNFRKARPA